MARPLVPCLLSLYRACRIDSSQQRFPTDCGWNRDLARLQCHSYGHRPADSHRGDRLARRFPPGSFAVDPRRDARRHWLGEQGLLCQHADLGRFAVLDRGQSPVLAVRFMHARVVMYGRELSARRLLGQNLCRSISTPSGIHQQQLSPSGGRFDDSHSPCGLWPERCVFRGPGPLSLLQHM